MKCILAGPAPRWRLEFRIANPTDGLFWINDDRFVRVVRRKFRLLVSLARGRMVNGAQPFGYFPPVMAPLSPGGELHFELELGWPLSLSDLWNDVPNPHLQPGSYQVALEIGYATSAHPPSTGDIRSMEDDVLKWQKRAISPWVEMIVPDDHAVPQHQ